jgi:Fic family protein
VFVSGAPEVWSLAGNGEMMAIRDRRLQELAFPPEVIRLMLEITEAKGRYQLYKKHAGRLLRALGVAALHQSVACSTRMDGVTIASRRVYALLAMNATAKSQSENEVLGYAQALKLISADASNLRVTSDLLCRMHKIIVEGTTDARHWKEEENIIMEFRANELPGMSFGSFSTKEISSAMDDLCNSYSVGMNQQAVHPLPAVGAFVFDFLCLQPFREGNGRLSRLLALLCLYQHGFEIGQCISLEHLIEDSRDDYYKALRESREGSRGSKHDVVPWLHYFFGLLRRAYAEFERRLRQLTSPRGAMTVLVETAVDSLPEEFTVSELGRTCPGVSHGMICHVLNELEKKDRLEHLGRGHAKSWRKKY